MRKIIRTRRLCASAMAVVLVIIMVVESMQTVYAKTSETFVSAKERGTDEPQISMEGESVFSIEKSSDMEISSDIETPEVKEKAGEITQITADGITLNEETILYPADKRELTLKAELDIDEEYSNSNIEWSVSPVQETIRIENGQSAKLILSGLPDEKDSVTADITAVVDGHLTKTVSIKVKRKNARCYINDINNLEYGDTDKALSVEYDDSMGDILVNKRDVFFALEEGGDIADIDEDGGLKIKKVGKFMVKATLSRNGYYEEASALKEFTVSPKKVGITIGEGVISKISDGTKDLTAENKSAIRAIIKPNGILDGDETILSYDISALKYDVTDIYIADETDSGSLYNNRISLAGLESIELKNNDAGNYELDMKTVETLKNSEIPAFITAKKYENNMCDMMASGVERTLEGFDIVLAPGIQGANEDAGFWYGEEGILINNIKQGLELLTADMESAVNDNGYLSVESECPIYVRQTQGDSITYYGPYIVKYQKDVTAPDITAVSVNGEKVNGVEFRTYTIILTDEESGINESKIECYLKTGNKEIPVELKKESKDNEGHEYSFEVSVPASGKLCIKAEDMVGNGNESREICALVVEEDCPKVKVYIDGNETDEYDAVYAQKHTVTVEAKDEGEGQQSGIQKICYIVKDTEGNAKGDKSREYDAPESLEDIKKTLEIIDEFEVEGYDGECEIVVWAVDQCGNESERVSRKIYFDNSAPSVTIKMDDKYGIYHRKDNCGIEIIFEDERLGEGGSYSVIVSDSKGETLEIKDDFHPDEDKSVTVCIEETDLEEFEDGEVTITVSVVDNAGNKAVTFAEVTGVETIFDSEEGLKARFILDDTPPLLKNIESTGTAKNPDETAYYYNDKEGIELTYTVEEINPPEDGWTFIYTKDETEYTINNKQNDNEVTFALEKEGRYSNLGITGEDRAGNKLILDENYKHEDWDEAKQNYDNSVVLIYDKVLDWTSPEVVLKFSEPHSTYGYGMTSYYGEGGFNVEIDISDKYPLSAEMFSYSMGETKSLENWSEDQPFKDLDYEESKPLPHSVISDNEKYITGEITSVNEEGYYALRIKGTDRAGNAAVVRERVNGEWFECLESNDTKGDSYYTSCNKVIDQTAPKAVIESEFKSDESDPKPIFGKTSYYNKPLNVKMTFSDNNILAGERIKYYISNPMPSPVKNEDEKIQAEYSSDAECNLDGEGNELNLELYIFVEKSENGIYVLKLSGEDKAGNPLIVTEKIGDNAVQDNVDTSNEEGKVFTSYNKVYDTEAPETIINFTDLDESHIYGDGKKTSYYCSDYGAELVCMDNNILDNNCLSYQISKKVDTPIDDKIQIEPEGWNSPTDAIYDVNYNEGKMLHPTIADDARYQLSTTINMPKEDGAYAVRIIKGEDKAGNKLIVKEQIGGEDVPVSDTDNDEDSYFVTGNKVYDSINPTYSFEITDPGQEHILDNTAYYNGDIRATFEIKEINFDVELADTAISTEAQAGDYGSCELKWVDVSGGNGFVGFSNGKYKYEQTAVKDGVYRFELKGEDKAGNPIVPDASEKDKSIYNTLEKYAEGQFWSYNKVRDTEAPRGVVVVQNENGKIYYKTAIESSGVEIAEPYRDEKKAVLDISAYDNSPVQIKYSIWSSLTDKKTEYYRDEFKYEQCTTQTVEGPLIFKVTDIVVTDMAGNEIKLASTNSIYLDTDAPTVDELAPTIEVVAKSDGNSHTSSGTPLFKGDVPLSIKVKDPYAGKKSSGLALITYELYIDDSLVEADSMNLHEKGLNSWKENYDDPKLEFSIDKTVIVSAQKHNHNNIKVVVEAEDNAGNKNKAEYKFGIDITPPVIEINYDNNSAENGKYFKADRTATITVKERNFDPNRMSVITKGHIGGWSRISTSKDNGDNDIWAASVKHTVDDMYTLDVTGADRVGNSAKSITYNGTAPRDFVLDKTAPVIKVSFNNNNASNEKYYNAGRTAIITVEEINFAGVNSFSVDAAAGGMAPVVAFNGKTASLPFSTDGNYSFRGTVTDMAGNESAEYVCEEFVIDTKRPIVEIDALIMGKDGVITPRITITDNNLDPDSCEIKLTRNVVSWDSRIIGRNTHTDVTEEFVPNRQNWNVIMREYGEDREEITLLDPGHDKQRNDGIYTLEVKVKDKADWFNVDSDADNEYVGIVRKYVVNRYGTVYEYSEGLLSMEDTAYCRKEGDALYIKAYNASEFDLEKSAIKFEVRCDGEVVKTELNPDIVEADKSVSGWYEYCFDITAEDFQKDEKTYRDGRYEFVISDRDKSGNTRTNSANPLSFYIDSTKPVLENITGLEEDHYYGAEKAVSYSVSDTIGLAGVKVYIDDIIVDEANFIDDMTWYEDSDNSSDNKANGGNRTLYSGNFTVGSGMWQNIRFEITDKAGNVFDTGQRDDETLEQIKKFGFEFCPVITVSTNILKLWYAQRALFWGSIAGIVSMMLIFAVIIILKRRKNGYNEE